MVSGIKNPIDLPKANVLIFQTEHGIRVAIRPSGTRIGLLVTGDKNSRK